MPAFAAGLLSVGTGGKPAPGRGDIPAWENKRMNGNVWRLGRGIARAHLFCGFILTLIAAFGCAQAAELLYYESFENGWNGWTNDTTYNTDKRHAWVVGVPNRGPVSAHTGTNCAGTMNPGNDCYLVSPPLLLPAVNQYTNHLWLFYWQWQHYSNVIGGTCLSDVKVRQRQQSPMGDYWGPWNIIDPGTSGVIDGNSPTWRRRGIDLTLFSGGIVQLGFGHCGAGDPGWCVDDVEIWNVPVLPNWPGVVSFESGWEGWHADLGIWDIGVPVKPGPANVPDGLACAGTAIDGVVPTVFASYLWSPAFYLPPIVPGEKVFLRFDQWHDYPSAFGSGVWFSQWWSSIGWSFPQLIDPEPMAIPVQKTWKELSVDITRLANSILPIRLGFAHNNVFTNTLGWFIDNVQVEVARLRMLSVRRAGDDLVVSWLAPTRTTNVLQCSPALGFSFTNVASPVISTGLVESVSAITHVGAAAAGEPRFYRIRRWP